MQLQKNIDTNCKKCYFLTKHYTSQALWNCPSHITQFIGHGIVPLGVYLSSFKTITQSKLKCQEKLNY